MPQKKQAKAAYNGWVKKDFKPDDLVELVSEVNGMVPGTKLSVKSVQGGGAVFVCEILTGPKHGGTVRVKAEDIQ